MMRGAARPPPRARRARAAGFLPRCASAACAQRPRGAPRDELPEGRLGVAVAPLRFGGEPEVIEDVPSGTKKKSPPGVDAILRTAVVDRSPARAASPRARRAAAHPDRAPPPGRSTRAPARAPARGDRRRPDRWRPRSRRGSAPARRATGRRPSAPRRSWRRRRRRRHHRRPPPHTPPPPRDSARGGSARCPGETRPPRARRPRNGATRARASRTRSRGGRRSPRRRRARARARCRPFRHHPRRRSARPGAARDPAPERAVRGGPGRRPAPARRSARTAAPRRHAGAAFHVTQYRSHFFRFHGNLGFVRPVDPSGASSSGIIALSADDSGAISASLLASPEIAEIRATARAMKKRNVSSRAVSTATSRRSVRSCSATSG